MMKEDNRVTRREGMLEGISGAINVVYNKIQELQDLEQDENQEFVEIVRKARVEWESAERTFHDVSDPDLVDFAIYNVEAAKAKYIYLLKQAKELGIKTNLY